ncbi:fructose-1,6-bisphosphatase 1-like [Cimex lectularius]|uniref:fructose-bisphosphatase n=1 Tax=Cimex lectularius TaxID=79782 RepID=A0A8I6SMN5_CIMLE|nr:fructose-1,6-bisphosphatase 1-like [Cimex lectularius]
MASTQTPYILFKDSNVVETLHLYMSNLEHLATDSCGQLSTLISFLQLAIKTVAHRLQRLKLGNLLSSFNYWTLTCEKVPSIINDEFIHILTNSGCCYQIISNLNDEPISIENAKQGKYIVCFQGINLDERNIACDLPTASIFSIYRKEMKEEEDTLFSQTLSNLKEEYLVASGYAIYGASVNVVIGIKNFGVTHYVLDPVLGELVVMEKHMKIPQKARILSINEGNEYLWEPQIVEYLKKRKDPKQGIPLKSRFTGCLAADFHCVLKTGGIYLCPSTRKMPHGQHSLICECIPLAFLALLCGGAATTGKTNILNVHPEKLKQQTPFFIGCGEEVYDLLHLSNP